MPSSTLSSCSSISAVNGGKCVDTSMGFTPLAGVPMGTRRGAIDYAAAEYLAKKEGKDVSEMLNYLNKKCGMAGLSGVSSDFRDLTAAADQGNKRAKLALDVFSYACKKYVGAYAAAMNGVDCIVFTAGVGENASSLRKALCERLSYLGIELDEEANKKRGEITEISKAGSKVRVFVIPTNEELVIAQDTVRLIK